MMVGRRRRVARAWSRGRPGPTPSAARRDRPHARQRRPFPDRLARARAPAPRRPALRRRTPVPLAWARGGHAVGGVPPRAARLDAGGGPWRLRADADRVADRLRARTALDRSGPAAWPR